MTVSGFGDLKNKVYRDAETDIGKQNNFRVLISL